MIYTFTDYITHIASYGSSPALSTADKKIQLNYKELVAEIKRFGYILFKKIKPKERVVIIDMDGPHWVITLFAIILNGGIAVPIDKRISEDLRKEILQSVGAKLVITCNPNLELTIETLLYELQGSEKNNEWKPRKIKANDPVEILYTSGTWGKPKGVVLTQNNLISNLLAILEIYKPRKQEIVLSILPLSHAYEQMAGLFIPLFSGCHIIYQKSLDSFSLLSSMRSFHPNYMVVVPKFLEILRNSIVKNANAKNNFLRFFILCSQFLPQPLKKFISQSIHRKFGEGLHTFIVGGAPLDQEIETFFRAFGFKLIIGYGLTESSPVLTISVGKRPLHSVGFPISNVSIRINEDGEVIATGPNISPGYWPKKSSANYDILSTGDIGHFDRSGRLILTGRKKDIVVFSTGDKIQLEDIENIANKFSGIKETCAVVIKNSGANQEIGITYVGEIDEKKCLNQINAKLPLFARVAFIQKWTGDNLPRTHTLKLQRNIIIESILSIKSSK